MKYMQAFRDALSGCGLEDLGYLSGKFTSRRKRSRHGVGMREILDRACENEAWPLLFPHACLLNQEGLRSDHRPILLDTEYYRTTVMSRKVRRKRFEGKWMEEERVREVLQATWDGSIDEHQGNVC
jgi:hypothetical protein